MKIVHIIVVTLFVFLANSVYSEEKQEQKQQKLVMSFYDRFFVGNTEKYTVKVQKYLYLRFANVSVEPKEGHGFSLMLYFYCDTKDLSLYDTPEKMKKSLVDSSKNYISGSVEDKVNVKEFKVKERDGFSVLFTDKKLADSAEIPEGEFLYITRGMVRLGDESALGFSLMTNSVDSDEYKDLLEYIFSFVIDPTEEKKLEFSRPEGQK